MQSHSCGALTDSVPTNVQNNGKEFYLKKISNVHYLHILEVIFKKNTVIKSATDNYISWLFYCFIRVIRDLYRELLF